jgi:hypothetical protein
MEGEGTDRKNKNQGGTFHYVAKAIVVTVRYA